MPIEGDKKVSKVTGNNQVYKAGRWRAICKVKD